VTEYIRKAAKILFWSFFIWIICRVFLFQTFTIPSPSMEPLLFEGDRIFVNKLAYGSRIPITPLSLPFEKTYINFQLPYLRLPGFSSVKHNDVIVFNYPLEDELPVDQRKKYVKRCLGLPGDTLSIQEGKIKIAFPFMKPGSFPPACGNENSEIPGQLYNKNIYSPSFFPNSSFIKWNPDYFGPLFIPAAGKTILLDKKNSILYRRVIEKYEHNTFRIRNDSVFINEKYRMTYTFKMDYYFVIGDNRYNSIDSRFWGFVPEDHLIGKASYILSSPSGKRSWSNIL
jgi:signal peptidase I